MPRRSVVQIRVSEDERRLLATRAEHMSMTVSEYMRLCISLPVELAEFQAGADPQAVVLLDAVTYRRLLIEARRWGNNFNQGVRALNTIARNFKTPPAAPDRVDEVVALAARAGDFMHRAKSGMDGVMRVARALEDRAAVATCRS